MRESLPPHPLPPDQLTLLLLNYYDEMIHRRQSGKFQFEEDPFSKVVKGFGEIYHEVILVLIFFKNQASSIEYEY